MSYAALVLRICAFQELSLPRSKMQLDAPDLYPRFHAHADNSRGSIRAELQRNWLGIGE